MTTNEILTFTRNKILEEGTEIIDDTRILLYANLAHKDVIKKAFPKSSINTATLNFVSGSVAVPADYGTLYTDALDTKKNVFPEYSIADFARLSNEQQGITVENGNIKVSPTDTPTLNIKYYPTYPTLTNAVNPTIDEYLHEPIAYGTVYRCFEDLQDPELAAYYKEMFGAMLQEKLRDISKYEEDSQRGGVMFNGIDVLGGSHSNDVTNW